METNEGVSLVTLRKLNDRATSGRLNNKKSSEDRRATCRGLFTKRLTLLHSIDKGLFGWGGQGRLQALAICHKKRGRTE